MGGLPVGVRLTPSAVGHFTRCEAGVLPRPRSNVFAIAVVAGSVLDVAVLEVLYPPMTLAVDVGDGVAAVDRVVRRGARWPVGLQPGRPLFALHHVGPSRAAEFVVDDGTVTATRVVVRHQGRVATPVPPVGVRRGCEGVGVLGVVAPPVRDAFRSSEQDVGLLESTGLGVASTVIAVQAVQVGVLGGGDEGVVGG